MFFSTLKGHSIDFTRKDQFTLSATKPTKQLHNVVFALEELCPVFKNNPWWCHKDVIRVMFIWSWDVKFINWENERHGDSSDLKGPKKNIIEWEL